ncbi:hypothetical protein SprV_0401653400 [Sparganum proliferum]
MNIPSCIEVLWIYILSAAYASSTTRPPDVSSVIDFRVRLWNLHGAQNFYPCAFKRSAPDVEDLDMIECDQKASQVMGNVIPTIYPDTKVVREIRISIQTDLTFIPAKAFQYVGHSLHTLTISGGRLRRIRKGAFIGLTQLRKLNITDSIGEKASKGIAHRLFGREGELATLTNLRELILQNVDLSDGLGERAFAGISGLLEDVRLVNNGLLSINETAFEGCLCTKSIKRFAIEQQPPNGDWIRSLKNWAKDLQALEEISLTGNNLSSTKELDFGETVGNSVRVLRIENCSLTSIGPHDGLNLKSLGEQLREIYVGWNLFDVTADTSKDALIGLARFDQLELISFVNNRGKMNRLPDWLGNTTIKTLDLSHSHLQQIGPGDLPRGLKTLKLQACTLQELKPMWNQGMVGLLELFLDETTLRDITIGNASGDWTTALKPLAGILQTLSLENCELISEGFMSNATDFEVARMRIGLLGFSGLRKVVISRNYLTHIPSATFQSAQRLQELHARDNLLQSIGDPNWSGVYDPSSSGDDGRMRLLDLTNNAITTLDRCAPALGMNRPLEELLPLTWEDPVERRATGFRLMGNPLICDCRLRWLSDYARRVMIGNTYERSRAVAHSLNFTCIGPGRWAGQRFLQLTPTMLQQEMHPDCRLRGDIYGEASQPNCRFLPPAKQPGEPANAEEAEDATSRSRYIFRPVRIFGYDAEEHKLWLAVRPDNLKRAWKSIARRRSQIDSVGAAYLEQILPIARIAHLPPQTIIRIKEDYAVFRLLFWPVEQQEAGVRGPLTWHVTEKGAGKREYIFSAQPVFSNSAYTVCLRDALAMKTSVQSTICQIFQPSEILGKIKVPPEEESDAYNGGNISVVWMWAAAITVSCLLLLIVLLLILICLYKRRTKKREKRRLQTSSTVLREPKHRFSSSSAAWVTDSIYAKIHGSPAGESLLRDGVKLPVSNDDDGLYERLEDFNAGNDHITGAQRCIGSPSMSERSMPNLNCVDGYRTNEASISARQVNTEKRRRASSNLPELPRRTPKPDSRIRFRGFGVTATLAPAKPSSASTGDLYHSGSGTPRPGCSSRRFIQNNPKSTSSGWRTSLTQKIRRSLGESGLGTRKGTGTSRKSKSPSPPDPRVSEIIGNEGFSRSPKCTIPSPKLPPPFALLASEKNKQGSSTDNISTPGAKIGNDDGYLSMQLPDTSSALQMAQKQQCVDAYLDGAGEAQLTDSYILCGPGIRDFMQSCATGRSEEARVDKQTDAQLPRQLPLTAKAVKLYSPTCSARRPILVNASEKTAPLCLPEVDSPIENCDSSS